MALPPGDSNPTPPGPRRKRIPGPGLRTVGLVFLVGFVLHTADHFRRGLDVLTPEVLWAGSAGGVITLAAIGLALLRNRFAPVVAVGAGFAMASGVAVAHLLPRWSAFSDSLLTANADPLTWLAVLCEIGGALAFGWVGVRAMVHR